MVPRRETKLSTNVVPNLYRVIENDGNAIVLQDAQGKLRNEGHVNTFVVLAVLSSAKLRWLTFSNGGFGFVVFQDVVGPGRL